MGNRSELAWASALTYAVLLALVVLSLAKPLQDSTLGLFEVTWQHETEGVFIGSPSILPLHDGSLLASADRFGHGHHGANTSTHLSLDGGVSWHHTGWVTAQYWSNLFRVGAGGPGDDVYLLGTAHDGPAPIKISRSRDGGKTWMPEDASVIAGETRGNHSYMTGPTPTLVSGGRIYRAVEHVRPPYRWGTDFEAVVIHADAGADLIDPSSWTVSEPLPMNESWLPAEWPRPAGAAFLEGNVIEGPTGEVYNLLRLNTSPKAADGNHALLLRFDPVKNALEFEAVVNLPGGHTKFVVRRDPRTGLYISLTNPNTVRSWADQRNLLAICASADLRDWKQLWVVLHDDTGFPPNDSVRYTGFHYVDWQLDGEDIVAAVRTSYRGANTYHNSNRLTFKRLPKFRTALLREWRRAGMGLRAEDCEECGVVEGVVDPAAAGYAQGFLTSPHPAEGVDVEREK